jgi:hypothetical protein
MAIIPSTVCNPIVNCFLDWTAYCFSRSRYPFFEFTLKFCQKYSKNAHTKRTSLWIYAQLCLKCSHLIGHYVCQLDSPYPDQFHLCCLQVYLQQRPTRLTPKVDYVVFIHFNHNITNFINSYYLLSCIVYVAEWQTCYNVSTSNLPLPPYPLVLIFIWTLYYLFLFMCSILVRRGGGSVAHTGSA